MEGRVPPRPRRKKGLQWKTLAAGRFAAVELPALSDGKSWVTNDLYVIGTISVDGTRGTTLFVR